MKKHHTRYLSGGLFFVLLLLQGCYPDGYREWKTVYGEGPVTRETLDTPPFQGVRVSSSIDVYLRQGDQREVVLEADENLHEYIRLEVREGVLVVDTDASIRQAKSKKVYVTLPELKKISVSSSGDVRGESPFRCNRLDISVSSSGNVDMEVEAREIHCSLSSSGSVRLAGKTGQLIARLSSSGDLKATEMEADSCDLRLSSSGDARVFVTDRLDALLSSSGDLYYRGKPRISNVRTTSSGRTHAL